MSGCRRTMRAISGGRSGFEHEGWRLIRCCLRSLPAVLVSLFVRAFSVRPLVVQRELRGLEGKALQIPSSVGVRGAALPPLAPPLNRVFRGPEAPEPPFG